jgi:hypothetical protein
MLPVFRKYVISGYGIVSRNSVYIQICQKVYANEQKYTQSNESFHSFERPPSWAGTVTVGPRAARRAPGGTDAGPLIGRAARSGGRHSRRPGPRPDLASPVAGNHQTRSPSHGHSGWHPSPSPGCRPESVSHDPSHRVINDSDDPGQPGLEHLKILS